MTRRTINLLQFWLTLAFVALPGLSFWLAWYVRFQSGLFPPANVHSRAYFVFAVLITAFWAFAVERLGLNRISTILALRTGINTAARACGLCALLALSVFFFYRSVIFGRLFVVFGLVLLFVFSVLLIHIFRRILYTTDTMPSGRFSIAIVGADQHGITIAKHLGSSDAARSRVACFVALPGQTPSNMNVPVLPWERLQDVTDVFHCSEVFICLAPDQIGQSQHILKDVQHLCVPARMVMDLGEGVFVPDRVFDYYGIPLLDLRPYPVDTIGYYVGKRAFDILFSSCALLLGLPLFAGIALAIKLTSKGPVFFAQERVSLNGRKFTMIKFRSMYSQSRRLSDQNHTMRSDSRITPVGRFLRRTSLDEIPQFWNVLCGDMSVVGPRPELTFFVQKFRNEIPWYMARHNVKPGITGWAQVNGLRGSDTCIRTRVEYDLQYMQNWSFYFDIRIIAMTLVSGLIANSAY